MLEGKEKDGLCSEKQEEEVKSARLGGRIILFILVLNVVNDLVDEVRGKQVKAGKEKIYCDDIDVLL